MEVNERETLQEVSEALKKSSSIPYNNASHVYEAANESPDIRLGASCLSKLDTLKESFPEDVSNLRYITSMVGKITHYAILADIEGKTYYFDPFLWQVGLIETNTEPGTEVSTLQNNWVLRKEINGENSFLSISLVDVHDREKPFIRITHNFTQKLDFVPNASLIPLKPHLPNYMMQILDPDGIHTYKLWYSKEENCLYDILNIDTSTGKEEKSTRKGKDTEGRKDVLKKIELITGATEQDIVAYFKRANELEVALFNLMQNMKEEDTPHIS